MYIVHFTKYRGIIMQDLIGKRFGNLVVIDKIGSKNRRIHWKCQCDCGKYSEVSTTNLKRGNSTRCSNGCHLIKRYNFKDLSGKRFGKLLVKRKSETKTKTRGVRWVCECDCGKTKELPSNSLTSGNTKSCGCSQYKMLGNIIPTSYINAVKQNAVKRDIEFEVSIEYLESIFTGECVLSGKKIKFNESGYQKDNKKRGNASLDRLDSKIGYIEGNVQWLDKDVNKMKNNKTDKEFIDLCKMIADKN